MEGQHRQQVDPGQLAQAEALVKDMIKENPKLLNKFDFSATNN